MAFFGVELNSQINRLFLETRLKLAQNKTYPNLRTIYQSFANYDLQASGQVSAILFQKALNQNGLYFKQFQIQAFQKAFQGQPGLINWHNFLSHLREPMSPHRRSTIDRIFEQISNGKGSVSLNELKAKFHTEGCDSFQKVTKDQKMTFDKLAGLLMVRNSEITKEEFVGYYDDININFPSDEAFVRYACSQWNSKLEKPEKVSGEEINEAIKGLRFKLIQKTEGTKDEFLLRKLFSQFDRNKSEAIGAEELDLMLKRLQLPTSARLVLPLLSQLDKNKSGYIEYDEFKKFIFFDPFPK